jgi:chemotaxis protein CheX
MDADLQDGSSGRVQLIFSAKSVGPVGISSKLAEKPPEETRETLTAALEKAAREVFEMMVGTPLGSAENATLPKVADYTAMIGLAGDLCGVISFRCATPSAHRIAAQMLGTEEDTSEECVRDALGEICNMIAGAFKAQISDLAAQCMLSVPTVVSGKDYQLYPLVDGVRVQVSLTFNDALLWITLDLHS